MNRYNGADVMFLFKNGSPLIINMLSFRSGTCILALVGSFHEFQGNQK